ncbi:MAG TPA: DUF2971 domain-containing protein [Candidatus Sulfotelmatobacter sp.]
MASQLKMDSAASAQIRAAKIAAQSVVEAHPELYHYTGTAGLKGIIESNSFRATYFADMNDAQEIYALRVHLVDELKKRLETAVKQARLQNLPKDSVVWRPDAPQRLARVWGNALYRAVFAEDAAEQTAFCCVASLCSHAGDKPYEREHGLLSQWRGYGKGGGFCLVFDTAALWRLFQRERATFFYAYNDLREAFYPRESSRTIQCFTELLNTSETVIKTALLGNRDFSVDETLLPFVSAATAFKHQGFYEEREVRLVAMAGTELAAEMERKAGRTPPPLKEVCKTSRGGRVRQHINLFGKDFAPLPLQRVIVGPSRSQDVNAAFARKIVGRNVPVSTSATPYIG